MPRPNKRAFHADYDDLFKPRIPLKDRLSGDNRARLVTTGVIIGLLVLSPAILITASWTCQAVKQHSGQTMASASSVADPDREFLVYPLRAAGVKVLNPSSSNQPLYTTIHDRTFVFSKGVTVTFPQNTKIFPDKHADGPITVLPKKSRENDTSEVADIAVKKADGSPATTITTRLYSNMLDDTVENLALKHKNNFCTAIVRPDINQIHNGYIVTSEDDMVTLSRYFMFPDGTGLTLDMLDMGFGKEFDHASKHVTYSELKQILPREMHFFEHEMRTSTP